jgi:dihydrofolate reductase
MGLSLIVAMTRSGVIGRAGGLPWKLSADLQRFKSLTMGHHIIMGRKTFESLGRVLPGRTTVVMTRREAYAAPADVLVVSGLDDALGRAAGDDEPFAIGGGEIFELALPRASRLYVTWVEADTAGDTYFPAIVWGEWHEVSSERYSADAKNEYDTTFSIYDRT